MTEAEMRLGIDLGGTRIEGVMLKESGDVVQRHRTLTPKNDYWAILNSIAGLVTNLTTDLDLPVGIGTPGSISSQTGLMRNSNSTCFNGEPLLKVLELTLNRSVALLMMQIALHSPRQPTTQPRIPKWYSE